MQRLRIASKFRVSPISGIEHSQPQTSEGYSVNNYNPIDTFMEVADRCAIGQVEILCTVFEVPAFIHVVLQLRCSLVSISHIPLVFYSLY